MPAGTPQLQDIVLAALDDRASRIYTAFPAKVIDYDSTSQTATLRPVMKRALFTEDDDLEHEQLPDLPNVPIAFPRSLSGFAITWPIAAGDYVEVLVQMYSFAQWRRTSEISEPGDLRLHHLSNAIAIPTLAPNANPIPASQAGANALVIEGVEIRLGADATDFVALSSKVTTELNAIKNAISHIVFTPGSGGGSLTNPGYSPGSVAATKTKAK